MSLKWTSWQYFESRHHVILKLSQHVSLNRSRNQFLKNEEWWRQWVYLKNYIYIISYNHAINFCFLKVVHSEMGFCILNPKKTQQFKIMTAGFKCPIPEKSDYIFLAPSLVWENAIRLISKFLLLQFICISIQNILLMTCWE